LAQLPADLGADLPLLPDHPAPAPMWFMSLGKKNRGFNVGKQTFFFRVCKLLKDMGSSFSIFFLEFHQFLLGLLKFQKVLLLVSFFFSKTQLL